jgi:hypothetical protein
MVAPSTCKSLELAEVGVVKVEQGQNKDKYVASAMLLLLPLS